MPTDETRNIPWQIRVRQEIESWISHGRYKPGEVLPSIAKLAEKFDTSEIVPRRALVQLAKDGWIRPCRGVGSIVVDRGVDAKVRGRVLLYLRGTGYGFYFAQLVATVRSMLVRSGWRLMVVSASAKDDRDGCGQLAELLKERWDLVIECGMGKVSRGLIEGSGWLFLPIGNGAPVAPSRSVNCIGSISIRSGKAVPDFVRACVRTGVRRIWQFVYDAGTYDVTATAKGVGIGVETFGVSRQNSPEQVSRGAMRLMDELLRRKGRGLPDVILFTDDYLAQGGLLSLLAHGIRIPGDVRVVTHANAGLGPVWTAPLTRLEMNPVAHGREIARNVLRYLKDRTLPTEIDLGSVWTPGQTF